MPFKFALKGKEGDRDLFEVSWNEAQSARAVAVHTMVAGAKASMVLLPTL